MKSLYAEHDPASAARRALRAECGGRGGNPATKLRLLEMGAISVLACPVSDVHGTVLGALFVLSDRSKRRLPMSNSRG